MVVMMLNRVGVYLVILLVCANEPDKHNPERVVDVGNQSVLVPGDVKARSAVTQNTGSAVGCFHIGRLGPIGSPDLLVPRLQGFFGVSPPHLIPMLP